MKNIQKNILPFLVIVFLSVNATCQSQTSSITDSNVKKEKKKKRKKKYKLPKIDLSHWKVTLPVGKPDEVSPPEILDYANNDVLKKYMYNDSTSGALVFYAFPGSQTANTKYSRSELREQMVPGDNSVNWTFEQGGKMRGRLKMGEISRDKNGKYHKTIIMQIHGRLTNEQRDLIGQKDNNAPPILKIYWKNGKVRVKTKVLKNPNASNTEILRTDAWTDDKGYTFKEEVGFKKFTLEVKVTKGKMVISLNDNEFAVYKDINIKRWGVFENYFKAGNYLGTKDKNGFAKVMYYELNVSH
ncbi:MULTISPECIES: polysaccharide lyase family 7 protein [Aquimarina]|uniref:Polysaccharide lyase family 7 protein n=1 Tax=Aquimarina algiphila TaxID=2047982 RepID=A0A554VMV2_9FLAO|nr:MULTISPECIES: polysaccharide lyase family 7 protein [Aquimarina]TSE09643.1 polysaccharide lyase family 7 protein [Aquimarina algiphila]